VCVCVCVWAIYMLCVIITLAFLGNFFSCLIKIYCKNTTFRKLAPSPFSVKKAELSHSSGSRSTGYFLKDGEKISLRNVGFLKYICILSKCVWNDTSSKIMLFNFYILLWLITSMQRGYKICFRRHRYNICYLIRSVNSHLVWRIAEAAGDCTVRGFMICTNQTFLGLSDRE
jgi:hypothetical protein